MLAAGVLLSGCFHQVSIAPGAVHPGEDVQVRVSDAAAARLVNQFGMYTSELAGQLAPEGNDSLSLSVLINRDYRGFALAQARQRLFLSRNEVIEVRRRKLSTARTALATAGVLVAFGGMIRAVTQEGDPNPRNDETPQPPPPGFRTLFKIRIR